MTSDFRQKKLNFKICFDIVRKQKIKYCSSHFIGNNSVYLIYTEYLITILTIMMLSNTEPLPSYITYLLFHCISYKN